MASNAFFSPKWAPVLKATGTANFTTKDELCRGVHALADIDDAFTDKDGAAYDTQLQRLRQVVADLEAEGQSLPRV